MNNKSVSERTIPINLPTAVPLLQKLMTFVQHVPLFHRLFSPAPSRGFPPNVTVTMTLMSPTTQVLDVTDLTVSEAVLSSGLNMDFNLNA